MSAIRDLRAKLLAIGGKRVIAQPEPHTALLLSKGKVFPRRGRKRLRREPFLCHRHACLLYAEHHARGRKGRLRIVRGYGLWGEAWYQHSWLWDGRRVVETNLTPDLYFGAVLNDDEALRFVFSQVMGALPGWEAVRNAA